MATAVTTSMPTVGDIVRKTTDFFREKGFESARLDSELLIARALGWERLQVFLKLEYPLSPEELDRCRDFVRRRSKGEPIAYILGEKGFYNSTFEVNSSTLIPRPETEMLVARGVEILADAMDPESTDDVWIVDLGCGTGCIGLSILNECPENVRALLVDISAEAVEVARRNAARLGLEGRVEFLVTDASNSQANALLRKPWVGRAALVVANPPYIDQHDTRVQPEVREFEPAGALFADENGLAAVRSWSKTAFALAAGGASTLFEIGDGQGREAEAVFAQAGWDHVTLARDLSDRERMVEARKGNGAPGDA